LSENARVQREELAADRSLFLQELLLSLAADCGGDTANTVVCDISSCGVTSLSLDDLLMSDSGSDIVVTGPQAMASVQMISGDSHGSLQGSVNSLNGISDDLEDGGAIAAAIKNGKSVTASVFTDPIIKDAATAFSVDEHRAGTAGIAAIANCCDDSLDISFQKAGMS
jgi:hypothetical protein